MLEVFNPPTMKLLPLQEISDTTRSNYQSVTVHTKVDLSGDEAFIPLFPDVDIHEQSVIQWNVAERTQLDVFEPGSGSNSSTLGEPGMEEQDDDPGPTSAPSNDESVVSPILPSIEPRRWAVYPTTLFQWGVLPISHITRPLPSPDTPDIITRHPSATSNKTSQSTFTPDRAALWGRIINGLENGASAKLRPRVHPWRRPEAWLFFTSLGLPWFQ